MNINYLYGTIDRNDIIFMQRLGSMEEPTEKETAAKENVLDVNFAGIPERLVGLNQWLVWRYEENSEGELKKPPFTPSTGIRADITNPQSWGSFSEAQLAYSAGKWDGIGLALVSDIVAIDIDDCIVDDVPEPRVEKIIRHLNTYFEKSPSGKGVRGFIYAALPGTHRRREKIELYEDKRYVTITGHHLPSTPNLIGTDQEKLSKVYYKIFPEKSPKSVQRPKYTPHIEGTNLVIEKALSAKNGENFRRYLNGDTSLWGEGGRHKSKSEADFTFCLMLCYWTNGDRGRIDAIYRSSGMIDAKWDERRGNTTYGQQTIEKALRNSKY